MKAAHRLLLRSRRIVARRASFVWPAMCAGFLLLFGCNPSVLGAPCTNDLECPTGQYCSTEGRCVSGDGAGESDSGKTDDAGAADAGKTDGGNAVDSGSVSDAGVRQDGGSDAGGPNDAGTSADGGTSDGGSIVTEGGSTAGACRDGLDNDGDGLRDCADPDCNAFICRESEGACDQPERCTSLACPPASGYLGPAVACRPANGICDLEERCSGTSPACPRDEVRDALFVCRADAKTGCDKEETCDGNNKVCPVDNYQPANTPCGVDDKCTNDTLVPGPRCNTTGACMPFPAQSCPPFTCNFSGTACFQNCATVAHCSAGNYCESPRCVPQKANGQPCSSAVQCSSGVCAKVYADLDGDGFGSGASVEICVSSATNPPAGAAFVAGDCCDSDKLAYPGQSQFFSVPNRCSNFDYNCSASEDPEVKSYSACIPSGGVMCYNCTPPTTSGTPGWMMPGPGIVPPIPGCGQTALFVRGCNIIACNLFPCGVGCNSCVPAAENRTQACR